MSISLLTRQIDDPVTEILFENIPTPPGRFRYLCLSFNDDTYKILQEFSYPIFLKTIYWKIIRDYLIQERGGKCEKCDCEYSLNIHHKTYQHHGREHEHLENLKVLCKLCHEQDHVPIEEVQSIIKILALEKKIILPPEGKDNPNYDPRAIIDLRRMLDNNEVI